jgi:hypothetical protein
MIRDIQEIQALATKYSKQQLAQMAQMGMLDPTKAVMAGMMIKRIEEQNQKPPQTTVAQDVLGTQQQMPMQGQQQQPMPPQQQPPQMAQAPAGIEGLPAGDVGNYAGGGIVAFGEGGLSDNEYYGLPIGGSGRSGSEGYWSRPVMPYGQQMRNVGSSIINGLRRIIQDPAMDEKDRAEAKAKLNALSVEPPYPDESRRGSASFTKPFNTSNNNAPPPPPRGDRVATPSAPTSSKPIEPPKLGAFDPNAVKLTGAKMDMPKIEELADIRKQREIAEEAEGFNKNLTKEQLDRLDEKQRKLEDFESRAGGEALMNFGLGLLGARRGQEWETAGKSGQAALNAYKSDVKDLRSAKDKLDERAEALRLADNQAKKTNSAADIAKRDAQVAKYDAAKLAVFNAETELTKTQAQVSATARGQDAQFASSTFATEQAAQTARENQRTQLQVAGIHAASQKAYALAVKEGQLDANIAKIMLDAEKNFMETQAPNYVGKPSELAAAAREHAQRALQQYLPNSRPAANAQGSPAPSNRPPLTQFGG